MSSFAEIDAAELIYRDYRKDLEQLSELKKSTKQPISEGQGPDNLGILEMDRLVKSGEDHSDEDHLVIVQRGAPAMS